MVSITPILKYEQTSALTSSTYTLLLEYMSNPEKTSRIQELGITVDSTGLAYAQYRLIVDGDTKIDDEKLNSSSYPLVFKFDGELIMRGKNERYLRLYVKSDGSNPVATSAWITGVEEG